MSLFNRHTGAPEQSAPYNADYVNGDVNVSESPVTVPTQFAPQGHAARVLPYRGAEYHGVSPDVNTPSDLSEELFDMGHIKPEQQMPEEREAVPVPVRIVTDNDAWEQVNFRTFFQSVNGTAQQIVGHNRSRKTFTLKNKGTVDLWISDTENGIGGNYFTIEPNTSQTINGVNAVYVQTSDGSTQSVAGYLEYIVESKRRNVS